MKIPVIDMLGIGITNMFTIDDWTWKNQKEMRDLSFVSECLESKIVIISLKSDVLKDAGIYIEKMDDEYVYNLWINTEGYPELDADEIDAGNEAYFQEFHQVFDEINRQQDIGFRIMGIGLETDFQYAKENEDVIQKSKNVMVWVTNE